MKRHLVFLLALAALGSGSVAHAHYAGTALLHLAEQQEPGRFLVRFVPSTNMKRESPIAFAYPAHCSESAGTLSCGSAGLYGFVTAHNLPRHAEVLVEVTRAHGSRFTRVMSGDQPFIEIPTRVSAAGAAVAFLKLGARHVLEGFDHLLFVLGLVLLTGFDRRVVGTVTAFTLAHSISLSLDALGIFSLPSGPVEAIIALSLVLVASAVVNGRESLVSSRPWSIAFGFGLFHGLGFAGALRELGLPEEHRWLSLVFFNLGVEIGQLAAVAVLYAGAFAIARAGLVAERNVTGRRALGYAVGGLGAFWFMERTLRIFGAT